MFPTEVDLSHMLLVSVILTVDKVIVLKIIFIFGASLHNYFLFLCCFFFFGDIVSYSPACSLTLLHLSGAWITGMHHHPFAKHGDF